MENRRKVLEVKNLKVSFFTDDGEVKAVNGVDFPVYAGMSLGIVGESGCGKSVTAQSIMRLVPSPPGRILDGQILLHQNGSSLDLVPLPANGREIRSVRGRVMSMIFQEPMTSLSPVHQVGGQIIEAIRVHRRVTKSEAEEIALEMLHKVRMPRPQKVLRDYPYQLSGGMRQRAMIAMALSCDPSLLIADEPTTALDVTVQAQILKLTRTLQSQLDTALMLITHDLGVVAQTADYVAVFYLGKVVEYGTVYDVFENPLHPYTQALFRSIPRLDSTNRVRPIKGSVPDPYAVVRGCPFRDRCPTRFERCNEDAVPAIAPVDGGEHMVRCFLHSDAVEGDAR